MDCKKAAPMVELSALSTAASLERMMAVRMASRLVVTMDP